MPMLISANRDETQFDRADEFDITRSPNPHVAFGIGIHHCLGAPLARLEAKVAFETLIERTPQIRLAVDRAKLRFENKFILHGLEELPVQV